MCRSPTACFGGVRTNIGCECSSFFFFFLLFCTRIQDLEELIIQAREMLRKIPGSFLQTVRSCCSDQCNVPLDTSRSLFCESVRYLCRQERPAPRPFLSPRARKTALLCARCIRWPWHKYYRPTESTGRVVSSVSSVSVFTRVRPLFLPCRLVAILESLSSRQGKETQQVQHCFKCTAPPQQ